jgi:hypothetical protein
VFASNTSLRAARALVQVDRPWYRGDMDRERLCRSRRRRGYEVGPVVAYGLPIAIGLLRASAQLPGEPLEGAAFLGELSLDGALRHTPGMLPTAMVAREAAVGPTCRS